MMRELTVEATVEHLGRVLRLLDEAFGGYPACRLAVVLAAEEAYVNIARYAYSPGSGSVRIRYGVKGEPPLAVVELADTGRPFNPLQAPAPDISLPAESREAGGLGILLIRELMDEVRYEYRDGQNILLLGKRLPPG